MGALPIPPTSRSLLGFCLTLLLIVSSCYCNDIVRKSVQVVGVVTCSDCTNSNLLSTHALSGLRVTIDCKVSKNDEFQTRGEGEVDEQGKFKVTLPSEILKEDIIDELKEECYAQLHSASNAPCPTHHGIEFSKIALKSKNVQLAGKHYTFSPIGKLDISPITCTSAFLWPHYKYPPLPKLPPHPWFKKDHPWFKKPSLPPLMKYFPPHPPLVFPPIYKPPLKPPVYEKPQPPPVPVYKPTPKPQPPPVPVYKPTPKPQPPPVPVYKPTPKPKPPVPVPVYHKPGPKVCPPPVPVYKKPEPNNPPTYTKPPVVVVPPVVPPMIYKKPPLPPPKTEIPPATTKKPCPPFPKLPPFPKIPPKYLHPIPKIPKKFFHNHPKFGKWPPIPPYSSSHP